MIEFQYQSGPFVVPEAVTAAVRCAPRGNRLRLYSAAFGPPVVGAGATLHFYGCDVEAYSSLDDAMRPTADALELFGDENGAQLAMTGGTLLFGCTVCPPLPIFSSVPHLLGNTVRRRRRCRRRPQSSPHLLCAGSRVSCILALHCRTGHAWVLRCKPPGVGRGHLLPRRSGACAPPVMPRQLGGTATSPRFVI